MDKFCAHQRVSCYVKREFYLFTCTLPSFSSIGNMNVTSVPFTMSNGHSYHTRLSASQDKITFYIASGSSMLKCIVSMTIGSETILLSESASKPIYELRFNQANPCYNYDLINLTSEDDVFLKMKQHPKDSLVLICRITYSSNAASSTIVNTASKTTTESLYNLKPLAAALEDSAALFTTEKVNLRIGEENEIVSKALLCARSPVFAKMFENDMKEIKENDVTISDINMNVLKVLISYLYTGKLSNGDCDLASTYYFDFVCDLYYAADKYDIGDLRQLCGDMLLPQISTDNVMRILKLALAHNDSRLKASVMTFFSINLDAWVFTQDWKNLVNDEPKIAAEILNFFDY